MGLRFRRRIQVAPGLHINLSKHGGTVSIGKPGATLNLGRGKRLTLGLPGTGLSYSKQMAPAERKTHGRSILSWVAMTIVGILVILYIIGRLTG